jgi:DNA-binding XRE family transcriptional regulator
LPKEERALLNQSIGQLTAIGRNLNWRQLSCGSSKPSRAGQTLPGGVALNAPRLKAESRAYFRSLGKHITELRKEIGMTQAELARALKVSQQTVFAYELGDRRVSVLMLVKLARIFDTSVLAHTPCKPLFAMRFDNDRRDVSNKDH